MKKSIYILLLGLLLATASVSLPALPAGDEDEFHLTVIHTNDEHANHDAADDGSGGEARLAQVVGQIRGQVENSVLLDAGDRMAGTDYQKAYLGQDNVQIMNLLAYDAMTLGNRDFNYGIDVLGEFIDNLQFPVVGANVDFDDSPLLVGRVKPYTILEVGGEQIGVTGLVSIEADLPDIDEGELTIDDDFAGCVQPVVDELEEMGIDKIILVTHIGYEEDVDLAEDLAGVDIIVGGYTHTLLSNREADAEGEYPTEVEGKDGAPVLVVQAGSLLQYVGRLDVTFDKKGELKDWSGDSIYLSPYITPDGEMQALLDRLREGIED